MAKFIVENVAEGVITLQSPGTNYRNAFAFAATPGAAAIEAGTRVRGTIYAPAWKVDRVELGGNYVEPLFGRPRRMQGMILAINTAANQLTVQVGYEAIVEMPEQYRASDYAVGQRVGWDNIEIPTFELDAVPAAR